MTVMMGGLSKLDVCISIAGGVGKNKPLIFSCYHVEEFTWLGVILVHTMIPVIGSTF